jgi:hypothetical protein
MSLSALVEFAQNFGRLSENTRDGEFVDTEIQTLDGALPTNASGPRPGLPVWVRQRTVEQELPQLSQGLTYRWKIEGPADKEQPPADVTTLGTDALAFYAPFHFYRKESSFLSVRTAIQKELGVEITKVGS